MKEDVRKYVTGWEYLVCSSDIKKFYVHNREFLKEVVQILILFILFPVQLSSLVHFKCAVYCLLSVFNDLILLLIVANTLLALIFRTIKYKSERKVFLSALNLVGSFETVNCTSKVGSVK